MSRKTVTFLRKIKQVRSKNAGAPATDVLPTSRVKGSGKMTFIALVDTIDEEDGRLTKAGRRRPGVDSGKVCTEPMKPEKLARLVKLGK